MLALYPMLSILFLAFHKKTDLVTGFSFPTTFSLAPFMDAWNEGGFGKGTVGQLPRRGDRHGRLGGAVAVTGYAFGTMRFRGYDAALQADRASG